MSTYSIWQLTENDAEEAGAVIARAFAEEPVHCYALPDVTPDERAARLALSFAIAVRYGCRYGEAWAVGRDASRIEGAGWWIPMPEAEITDERIAELLTEPPPADLLAIAERVLEAELAVDAVLARVLPQHHRHLQQLGVEPALQGQGLGRTLLAAILADAVAARVPLCLWTATPANLPFYRAAGMRLVTEGGEEAGRPAWWAFAAGLGSAGPEMPDDR